MPFLSFLARELLPVLLILYPLLLLLDDVEPGFVRSVVNPHVFLLAIVLVATVAPKNDGARAWSHRTLFVFTIIAAITGGVWVWWRLSGAGALGIVTALLSAIGIGAVVHVLASRSPSP